MGRHHESAGRTGGRWTARFARGSATLRGFTLVELLTALAIITLLAALLLPALAQARSRTLRIPCANHLRQLGIAFQSFAHDHGDRFPEMAPTRPGSASGGTIIPGFLAISVAPFQAVSNELSRSELLLCPADRGRVAAEFSRLQVSNVSYFVGLQADPQAPGSLVAGDRNLTNSATRPSPAAAGLTEFRLGWTRATHQERGNVLLADGHVEFCRSFAVRGPGDRSTRIGVTTAGPELPNHRARTNASPAPAAAGFPAATVGSTRSADFGAVPNRTRIGPGQARPADAIEKDAPAASVPPGGAAASPADPWDSPLYRILVVLAKLAYLLCLLWAILALVAFYLRSRATRSASRQ